MQPGADDSTDAAFTHESAALWRGFAQAFLRGFARHPFYRQPAGGCCGCNEYEKAGALLESLSNARLHGILKIVHRFNLQEDGHDKA